MSSRTVSFLFTDIEGSTRLWDESPEAMRPALARHDALVREAIAAHGGETFKTVGDAFCAAFDSAPAAVAATLAAQTALAAEPWATPRPIRVRMALHTGEAEARDDDYFGPPLNRVARLLATGHGGQTLLSAATYELVRDALPPGASLGPLGEHRLKDLARPEAVYGLLHPALPSDFPPLRSLDSDALPNNLPEQTTSFVGRERELADVAARLKSARLLTLLGPGGTGKTRLALQAAAEAIDAFPGGVWLVELAALDDPVLVPQTVAHALGAGEEAGKPLLATLTERLRKAPTLLLLDNCEHLLDAAARLADALAKAVPTLRILATSREPLGVGGETVHRVPTLSLPKREAAHSPESLSHFEAVRLFVERAVAQRADFAVTNANAPAVASLCLHLDGIPLAIELAAARVRSLSVEGIDARLDDRFRLLTGGSRTSLPRQQTLRALIEWSHGLLNDAEAAAFRRLAAFSGGWTLEAAEAVVVGEGIEDWEVLDLVSSLVDKSLATAEESGGAVRYGMLETIRHFAGEKLREAGEEDEAFARHVDFFVALAETLGPFCEGDGETMRRLASELDNLRAASDRGTVQQTMRQLFVLRRFFLQRGIEREALNRARAAFASPGPVSEEIRLGALIAASQAATDLGELDLARAYLEEALPLARRSPDVVQLARVLNSLGIVAQHEGDLAQASKWYHECIAVHENAPILTNLSGITTMMGDFETARRLLDRAFRLTAGSAQENRFYYMVELELSVGNVVEAERLARLAREEALARESMSQVSMLDAQIAECRRLQGDAAGGSDALRGVLRQLDLESQAIGVAKASFVRCALDLGLTREARKSLAELIANPVGSDLGTCLELAARCLTERPREASILLGAADAFRARRGMVVLPVYADEYARLVAELRTSLGEGYEDARTEGAAMDVGAATTKAVAALA